jgi:hypothetical protein
MCIVCVCVCVCHRETTEVTVTEEDIQAIQQRLQAIVEQDLPINVVLASAPQAIAKMQVQTHRHAHHIQTE